VRKPDSKSHAARLFYWEIRQAALAANGHDVVTKKAVLLWNTTLGGRQDNNANAIPYVTDAYFKQFESDMAADTARASSMAAARAAQQQPHGQHREYAHVAHAPMPHLLPNFTSHGAFAAAPPIVPPVPTTMMPNPGGRGSVKTCPACRGAGHDGVRFTHEHRTSCYHRKAEAQEKEAAAKVAATATSVGDEM
jgi:hypothetical protein